MARRSRLILLLLLLLGLYAAPHLFAVRAAGIAPQTGSVIFTDRSGIALGTVLGTSEQRAAAVPLERISPYFVQAVLATEDVRYYEHGAVDWLALGRAAWWDALCVCNRGGASTITMQVARMHFNIGPGARGKALQIWDAMRIEAGSDKSAILNAYVNGVAMGGNIYGVEAASRAYFGVPAGDIDLAQAALLAGIPNDPVGLDPRTHWQAARSRQRYVLARMSAAGKITPAQAAVAARENIHLRRDSPLAAAQQMLFAMSPYSSAGGVPVRTTIDLPLQRFIQAQAQDVVSALSGSNVSQASVIVADNRTGDVLAYLGSIDYFDDAYLGRNDGARALRQPGSTLKPFLYQYALERGDISPGTILADVPASYAIPNGEIYSPEDYSRQFSGPVSVRTALANSLNVPAVRVLSTVGVPAFLDRLHELGFSHLQRTPAYYGLGLTLGAGEVSLWDLAHAYVTLARNGSAIDLRTAAGGPPQSGTQLGAPSTWAFVTDVLSDRYARAQAFGLGSVIDMPFPAAVKTGTSSGYRDTWTIGYTPEYTVAVWIGNFTGAPMSHIAGVTGAAPLWNRIMLHLYEHRTPPRFSRFSGRAARAPAPALRIARASRAFDEWRLQQNDTSGPLRILFPHDGDVFEDALRLGDPQRAAQQIAFRISRPKGIRVAWTIDGRRIATSGTDAYYWTVRQGTWTLGVAAGGNVQTVRFTVIRRPERFKRGFGVIGADSKTN